jgi:hypothetical protein
MDMAYSIDMACSMDMDMDMQYGHGHAARIWSCGMDLDRDMHGCMDAGMPDKKRSPASLVFRYFTTLSPASAFRPASWSVRYS